jgi:DNA-binding SARP family transcriptional activator/tetratricopeptide (TPR) repeat protein
MLELRILGGLSVRSARPLGRTSTQTRRIMVLALLAHAGERGLTRDQLMALLWPEDEPGAARRRLTQTLYALRTDLAEGLFSGTGRIALASAELDCDLWRFRRAIAEERWDDAVAAYGGPLLDGVFVDGAPELERWIEVERAVLANRFLEAGARAAAAASHRGDPHAALGLWRRLTALDPHNAGLALGLARAMADAGDRAGALSSIHGFGVRLREELGLPQDGRLIVLDESIRREMQVRPAAPARSAAPDHRVGPPPEEGETSVQRPGRPERRWTRWLVAGALAAVGLAAVSFRSRARQAPGGPIDVTVLPFAVTGDSASAFLGAGVARLVADGLDGAGPLRAAIAAPRITESLRRAGSAPDSARRIIDVTGADRYLTGWVTAAGGALRIQATLRRVDRRATALGSANVTGSPDRLFALVDDLVRQLAAVGAEPAGGLARSAALGTGSLAAFRAFIEGEAHFRASRFADAVTSFELAVRADTAFGLASYRLSQAYDWNSQGDLSAQAADRALRHAAGLPWRERTLLEGTRFWRAGRHDSAEARHRAITLRYPGDAEAWFELGEVLFHANTIRGRPFREAGPAFERVLALDPTNRGALTHLARVEAYLDHRRRADSLLGATEPLIDGGLDPALRFARTLLTGDSAARASARRVLATEASHLLSSAATWAAFYARDLEEADAVAGLMQTGLNPNAGHDLAALFAFGRGQFQRAFDEVRAIGEREPSHALEMAGHLAILPAPVALDHERRKLALELTRWRASSREPGLSPAQHELYPAVRLYYLGMLAIRSAEPERAAIWADSLEQLSGAPRAESHARAFAAGIRAHVHAGQGDTPRALALLSTLHEAGDQGSQVMFFGGLEAERFLRAELLESVGRHEEALAVYESLVFGGSHEIVLAGVASLARARILRSLRRTEEAVTAYRVFLKTWSAAEPAARSVVERARAELASLTPS